ncbi:hypothetical protein [Actinoplanes sp. N902-109]|uniref:hypothetical protein n=1 Tax=Actinoplanes sp. (strain N902-109) TaxID=649831 RepID=UPI0012FC251F|nr:hypothetical protein [Actinoplanes sp. N902-109]
MGLLASEPLAATVGFALVLLAIATFTRYWFTGVMLIVAIAYVAVPYTRGGDYVSRILFEQVLLIFFMIARALHIAWTGYATRAHFKVALAATVALTAWTWILRGSPHKISVFVSVVIAIAFWRLAKSFGRAVLAAENTSQQQKASTITAEALIKRDHAFLEAIYKVTQGCPGKYVTARQISPLLNISRAEAEVATHRLESSGLLEENEYGYALTPRGVQSYEIRSVNEKRRSPVSNIFNFHGSASGVFGSGNDVRGNKFTSHGVSPELIEKTLAAAAELRTRVPHSQAEEIDTAALDVRAGVEDSDRLARGSRRLAQIATSVGEVGAPLLKATTDLISAIMG